MDKGTLIRTIILGVALINQFLVTSGFNPIPGSEEAQGEFISLVFTFVAAVVAWFKNNYVTAKGKNQREAIEQKGVK